MLSSVRLLTKRCSSHRLSHSIMHHAESSQPFLEMQSLTLSGMLTDTLWPVHCRYLRREILRVEQPDLAGISRRCAAWKAFRPEDTSLPLA